MAETAIIKLKHGAIPPVTREVDGETKTTYPNSIEISIGTKSLKVKKSEKVEVPLKELQLWINTGRFELLSDETDPDEADSTDSDETLGGEEE